MVLKKQLDNVINYVMIFSREKKKRGKTKKKKRKRNNKKRKKKKNKATHKYYAGTDKRKSKRLSTATLQ